SERLVINKKSEDKANAGREILKKTDRDQAQMARGVAKPNQRNSGDDSSRGKDDGERQMRRAKDQGITTGKKPKIKYCQRQEKQCLQKEPGNGSRAGLFSQQSV